MAAPPPKPKGTEPKQDLHEVERALSVLQGRHPEHERARREDDEQRRRRAAEIERTVRDQAKRDRSRRLGLLAIGVPVVLLLAFIAFLFRREIARRSRIEQATDPFRSMGFVLTETSPAGTPDALEATLEPGCFVAVGTDAAAGLKVTRAGASVEGRGPVLFCTCSAERISVAAPIERGGGIALLRIDASAVGGSRAFAFAPFKPGTALRTDDACAEASFDAWIDAKRYPGGRPSASQPNVRLRGDLLRPGGFEIAATAQKDQPLTVVDVPKESCLVAVSDVATDHLGVRVRGGVMAVPPTSGPIARCAAEAGTIAVTREGAGEVTALVAPAAFVGGVLGLRQLLAENGFSLAAVVVPPGDRGWDGKQVLVASQVPAAIIGTAAAPDVEPDAEARIVALSFETARALSPELPADVYSYCEPALDAQVTDAVCIFSGAQRWRAAGAEASGGLARAKLPFWLYTMQAVSDPVALKGMTQLLGLARRLGRERFVPTTLEALTELPNGVEVSGRAGEDAVVAVGVAPAPPWVFPLTDGAPWTLDGPPRIAPLKPVDKVTLTTPLKPLPPKEKRRTVVFRRQAQATP